MDTYICAKCGLEICEDNRDNHELYCNSFNQDEYLNLIPCEFCDSLIESIEYNSHVMTCSNRNVYQPSNINIHGNIGSLITEIISSSNFTNIPSLMPLNNDTEIINEVINEVINEEDNDEVINEEDNEEDDDELENSENSQHNFHSQNYNSNLNNMISQINNLYDILGIEPNIGYSDNLNLLHNNEYENLTNLGNQIGNVITNIEPDLVSTKVDEPIKCPICFEDVEKSRKTICNHSFCVKCLESWLSENNTCPVCMVKLNDIRNK